MNINEAFSSDESKEIYDKFLAIIDSRRDYLQAKYKKSADTNPERVAYSIAVNQVKKKAANNIEEPTTEEPMDQETRLKEMIISALSKPPIDEDETSTAEMGIIDEPISEDLDIGHEDNEPHMIKSELYQIGKYAMDLYKMMDGFENGQEVDFPAWLQSKITTAKNMMSSVKHYLDFELKEPQIDAVVNIASEEEDIDENKYNELAEGVFDRIKAQFKGATSNVGQRLKNVGAAIKGKPEEFQNPAVTSGMSKIKSKAQNFESDVKDMLNDITTLFPEEKLGKTPEIKQLIDSYKQLLSAVLKVNTTLASGRPINVNTQPPTTTTKPTPTTQPTSTPKPTSTSKSTKTWNIPSTASKTKARDEKGRFVSTKTSKKIKEAVLAKLKQK